MKKFDNLRLATKLGFLVVVVILCLAGAGVALANLIQREMLAGRIEELKGITETATNLAAALEKHVEAGETTREDAMRTFTRDVRSMIYDGGQGYIFAYLMDGTAVAVPDPAQLNTNRLDVLINGRKVIREIRDAVQADGSAIIHYDFPRKGELTGSPKVSYAARFPAWDMFIGTGSYIDDLDRRFRPVLWSLVVGLCGLAVLVTAIAALIARRISRPLRKLESCMKNLAAGSVEVFIPGLERRDEVGTMAGAVAIFKENAIKSIALEAAQSEARARRGFEDEQVRVDAEQAAAREAAALVVSSIGKGLERLAAGDLTYRLEGTLPPAYEALRNDLNAATRHLNGLVQGIVTNTSGIRHGTEEIAQAADDLAHRTAQQAAGLEETAVALDEITKTVRKTAEGAKLASDVVSLAQADAAHAGKVVQEATAAMSAIERSSREIGQIIGVIDEIAFQTSLLALNAGIEAARAGDAGRGFAVVASEVRALAQRSAAAAQEIKTLISASTRHVTHGVGLVGETGQALERIVTQVAEISDVVIDIASSAQRQAIGLQEINVALTQMDDVTQRNAAMVEESTAASRVLAQETGELADLVSRFRLDRDLSQTMRGTSRAA